MAADRLRDFGMAGRHPKDMLSQLSGRCWADVYFYEEDGVHAESLTV